MKRVLKALFALGPQKMVLFAAYQAGLRTGFFRWQTPASAAPSTITRADLQLPNLPINRAEERALLGEQAETLFSQAGEVCAGKYRPFGSDPVPLNLVPETPPAHWTAYERGQVAAGANPDIKFTWEPGRFGWAILLARAYLASGSDTYAQYFWRLTDQFLRANPANLGPQWMSGQEVAIRLIALVLCGSVFQQAPSTTPAALDRLAQAVVEHARRIPPTLVYARAQNNNHLVSEAAGLFTAGMVFPHLPEAARWRRLGWKWLNRALQDQIAPDGTYMQHSTNYHRLVLQVALWCDFLVRATALTWPSATLQRLGKAATWLTALVDTQSGGVPNLGANDGALVFSLGEDGFGDFRPTAQAAALAFLGHPVYPGGPWNELSHWLGVAKQPPPEMPAAPTGSMLVVHGEKSWASLRCATLTDRPSHADQLHVDLWWQGENIARDPGTFQYNAPPPWDNGLVITAVHNTITVDDRDQMTLSGRFLWLDWAQGQILHQTRDAEDRLQSVTACHSGYRSTGIDHRRTLKIPGPQRWLVEDQLIPIENHRLATLPHRFTLQWLLPDWPYEIDDAQIILKPSLSIIRLAVEASSEYSVQLVRAGQVVHGGGEAHPVMGWYSPTYGIKEPALSFRVTVNGMAPVHFFSTWELP